MPRYAMAIDLHKCVGCGACDLACKSENNVPEGFLWADHFTRTTGKFPDVRYEHVPTLCNHCDNPPCANACPTGAMYKAENGMVLHDSSICIGCKSCVLADPYDVIDYNARTPFAEWGNSEHLAMGLASPAETAKASGAPFPYYNPERARTYDGIRQKGTVEKCTFCDHRVAEGESPWCVESCPAHARIFGDLDDPRSPVSVALRMHKSHVLQPEKGTAPNVYYLREYGVV